MLAVVLLFGLISAAAAGTAEDPVVSLSYIQGIFVPEVESMAEEAAENWLDENLPELEERLDEAYEEREIERDITKIGNGIEYAMYMGYPKHY